MSLEVKLQVFEGPLDLLLYLIEKNKVDIYDIPIVEITDQYLAYVKAMEKQDLNVVSEFLVMAAQLLYIKSKMLLPKPEEEEEEDNRERAKSFTVLVHVVALAKLPEKAYQTKDKRKEVINIMSLIIT